MATFFSEISPRLQDFITQQKVFFVATAPLEGRINLSPKGMDSLRILSSTRVAWLNVTGSGNETAAHLLENPRITLMFCAFEGPPKIVRLYGNAKAVYPGDANWEELASNFTLLPGTRQIFDIQLENAQTSCGMSIPYFDYVGERNELNDWASQKGKEGIETYWKEKNLKSIDGKSTGLSERLGS